MTQTNIPSARLWLPIPSILQGLCGLWLCVTLAGCATGGQTSPPLPAEGQARPEEKVRSADKPRAEEKTRAEATARPASETELREDVFEAVFRHMCQAVPAEKKDLSHPVTAEHKVYFLSISAWYDPRQVFLKRLNDLSVPVKPIAAGEWRGAFIYDRATGERGAAFYIQRITLISDDEADVDAIVNPGGPRSSCGWFYHLNRKGGRWMVTRERWKWMS